MHSSIPKLIVIFTNLLEHEFRYLTLTTFAVMQSQVSKYLVIKDWLLFNDLRKTALSSLASHPVPTVSASKVAVLAVLESQKMFHLHIASSSR